MAEKLQQIKRRMKSVESTKKITNAMKLVASARLKKAAQQYQFTQNNLDEMRVVLGGVAASNDILGPAYFQEHESGVPLAVVISGSKGFCGNYNVEINKQISEYGEKYPDCVFYPVGQRGFDYCEWTNQSLLYARSQSPEELSYPEVLSIVDKIVDGFFDGTYSRIDLISTHYVNSLVSAAVRNTLLPLSKEKLLEEFGSKEVPELELSGEEGKQEFAHYVLQQYLGSQIYEALKESILSELSARRSAMSSASDNASNMLDRLELTYNRARQAAITNEIIEIISGAEAQKLTGDARR